MKNSKVVVAVLFVVMNLVVLAPTTSYAGKFFEFPDYERIEVPQDVKFLLPDEIVEEVNNNLVEMNDDARKEFFLEMSEFDNFSSMLFATTFIAMDTKYLVEYCNFVDEHKEIESGSTWQEVKRAIERWVNRFYALCM